jgi:hypothetical protein
MKVFEDSQEDAGMSSSGFISVCLMDESHITAHRKSDMGLLTIDLFTCGSRPDVTRAASGTIKSKLMNCELFAPWPSVNSTVDDIYLAEDRRNEQTSKAQIVRYQYLSIFRIL